MTYTEAMEKINSLLIFGIKPGLQRIRELIERIGSPDQQLKFVHIAGTNGKGSVSALTANTLKCAGYKTGLFISPYITDFRERFQINGEMISEDELVQAVEKIYPIAEAMKQEQKIITEFEFIFAVALYWYAQQKCDVVVLETGLGGRFDATNIIDTPLVSVITSISLDHTAILGDTYEKIAAEKCGIIKNGGITVAYGEQPGSVMELIRKTAEERNNRFYIADIHSVTPLSSDLHGSDFLFTNSVFDNIRLHIPFIGEHQLNNAAAALYTISALREKGITINDDAVQKGFATVFFPARLELISEKPIVLLDGAHNPGGAKALSKAIDTYLSGRKKTAVVGMLADKDVEKALSLLIPKFDHIIAAAPDNPRAMEIPSLCEIIHKYQKDNANIEQLPDYHSLPEKIRLTTGPDDAVVVFGSLYLAGSLRPILKNFT